MPPGAAGRTAEEIPIKEQVVADRDRIPGDPITPTPSGPTGNGS